MTHISKCCCGVGHPSRSDNREMLMAKECGAGWKQQNGMLVDVADRIARGIERRFPNFRFEFQGGLTRGERTRGGDGMVEIRTSRASRRQDMQEA